MADKKYIDVNKLMNEAATSVPIDLLLARGKKNVKLLSRDKLQELINQAVMNIIRKYQYLANKAPAIQEETKQEFAELMNQHKKALEVQESLLASKTDLQKEIDELRFLLATKTDPGEDVLQKRIDKLTEYATNLETALKNLAEQKIYSNTQIQSILTELGINPQDKKYEKKMKMFKIILEDNKNLQKLQE